MGPVAGIGAWACGGATFTRVPKLAAHLSKSRRASQTAIAVARPELKVVVVVVLVLVLVIVRASPAYQRHICPYLTNATLLLPSAIVSFL
jgi:hypothetical protein